MMGYVGGCHVWSAFDVVAMYKELSLSTVALRAFIRTEIQSDTAASKKSMRLQRSFWTATEWIDEILGRWSHEYVGRALENAEGKHGGVVVSCYVCGIYF